MEKHILRCVAIFLTILGGIVMIHFSSRCSNFCRSVQASSLKSIKGENPVYHSPQDLDLIVYNGEVYGEDIQAKLVKEYVSKSENKLQEEYSEYLTDKKLYEEYKEKIRIAEKKRKEREAKKLREEMIKKQLIEKAKHTPQEYEQTKVIYKDINIDLFARLVYSEAGVEPYDGKIAVANVVLNRMEIDHETLEQVIFKPCQFDGVRTKWFNVEPSEDCKKAVIEAINGKRTVPKSTYMFADLRLCSPDWAQDSNFVKRIGDHWFFNAI